MQLRINGESHVIDAEGDTPLLWVLRDNLGMTGTKYGCGIAQCGACSVLIDGEVTRSCVTPVDSVVGRAITTIEAIERDDVGKRVVEAWVRHQVPQCGYCQSGQVMAATALLKQTAKPTDDEIKGSMINLCRCGTYNAIKAAVSDLAGHGTTAAAAGEATAGNAAPIAPALAATALVAGTVAVAHANASKEGEGA